MTSTELTLSSRDSSRHRQYARPPIVEVILQFTFAEGGSDGAIESVAAALRDVYPQREELFQVSAGLEIAAKGPTTIPVARELVGLQLQDATPAQRLVRVGRETLSIHEVRPWSGWASFQQRAVRVFDAYCTSFASRAILGAALRYINRIELPPNSGDLKQWITSAPDIPEGLPQYVATYSVEMTMPQPEPGVLAVVRQALLMDVRRPEICPIALDIEVQSHRAMMPNDVWNEVEFLHERENLIFERTITDRVRSLFE